MLQKLQESLPSLLSYLEKRGLMAPFFMLLAVFIISLRLIKTNQGLPKEHRQDRLCHGVGVIPALHKIRSLQM